jgi:hypothetical protein
MDYKMDAFEKQIVEFVNSQRLAHGRSRLESDSMLGRAARAHSQAMARISFFSHRSPVQGLEQCDDRVRAAGGSFEAVGENIAALAQSATAADFVQGWIKSPGHRRNLLDADWKSTGVGIARASDGKVYATQLFGVASRVALEAAAVQRVPKSWFVLRASIELAPKTELAAFLRTNFVKSSTVDQHCVATLDVPVPVAAGEYHVGFGRRVVNSSGGWISVYDGTLTVSGQGVPSWTASGPAHADAKLHNVKLFRADGEALAVVLRGRARTAALVLVDGVVRRKLAARRRFDVALDFLPDESVRTIDVGIPSTENRYTILHQFRLNSRTGELRSRTGS